MLDLVVQHVHAARLVPPDPNDLSLWRGKGFPGRTLGSNLGEGAAPKYPSRLA